MIRAEEHNELCQACNDFVYADGDRERMKAEAIQFGAMAIRFLKNIETYERTKSVQR